MAKVEPGMESMLEMYIFETNTLLEQLDEILLRTEDANVFSQYRLIYAHHLTDI